MTIEEHIESCKAVLNRYALSLTHNKEDAEDLYQNTVLHILIKREKYVEDKYFRTWASRIMRNLFIDKYRKDIKRKDINLKFDSIPETFSLLEFNNGESKLSIQDIYGEINNLREDYRQVVTLKLRGYSYKEMEDMLQLSSPTMRLVYFYGIRVLRKKLKARLLM